MEDSLQRESIRRVNLEELASTRSTSYMSHGRIYIAVIGTGRLTRPRMGSNTVSKYLNLLWPFVPAAIAVRYALPERHGTIFALNYIAMVPAANMYVSKFTPRLVSVC